MLTNVGLEHTRWLGPTITDIAAREAGGGARRVRTLVRRRRPASRRRGRAPTRAAPSAAPARLAAEPGVDVAAARGAFQRRNFALARAAAEAYLGRAGPAAVRAAAARRRSSPGASRSSPSDPLTVLDGAHNPAGMAALADALPRCSDGRPLVARALDPRRQGRRRRCSRELLPLCRAVVFTAQRESARAVARRRCESLAGQLGGLPEPRPSSATPAARWRSRARARRPRRRGARDRLDLPHRRPAARAGRAGGADAVNEDGPSVALDDRRWWRSIVALVILVFFALGYGFRPPVPLSCLPRQAYRGASTTSSSHMTRFAIFGIDSSGLNRPSSC